jgi:HD-like signal output (HDOD) protein
MLTHNSNKLPLTPIPHVMQCLQEALQTEDCQPVELLALIKIDPILTAAVIQFAALHTLKPTAVCDSLESVLSPALLSNLHPLLLELTNRATGFELHPYWIEYTEQFWHQSIVCAVIQESLAHQLELNPLLAYTTGLMFNIESLMVKQEFLVSQPTYRLDNKAMHRLLFEEPSFSPISNSADLLKSFHFSESVYIPIDYYKDPTKAPDSYVLGAQLLNLAIRSVPTVQSANFKSPSLALKSLDLLESVHLTEALYEKACMDAYKKYQDIQLFIS